MGGCRIRIGAMLVRLCSGMVGAGWYAEGKQGGCEIQVMEMGLEVGIVEDFGHGGRRWTKRP